MSSKTPLRYVKSTSEAAAELVFEKISSQYGYETVEECWNDRANHREEWASIIWNHNKPDGVTLYADMLADNDIFDGIRDAKELEACREHGIIHFAIWVDASLRLPPEGTGSCTVAADDCDVVINNNGSLEDLYSQLAKFVQELNMMS